MKSVFSLSGVVFGAFLVALSSGCASTPGDNAPAPAAGRYEPTEATIGTRIPKKTASSPAKTAEPPAQALSPAAPASGAARGG